MGIPSTTPLIECLSSSTHFPQNDIDLFGHKHTFPDELYLISYMRDCLL